MGGIVELIGNITGQINLLALNADHRVAHGPAKPAEGLPLLLPR